MKVKPMELLFSKNIITRRVQDLAQRISSDYHDSRPVLIGILKGSFIFVSDLVRSLGIDIDIDFIQVSSYGSSMVSSGTCLMKKDISLDIAGRHVLLIDDIIDTGRTTAYLVEHLSAFRPQSLRICCLISRQVDQPRTIEIDYAAFTISDGFVVGYGLDFDERYRGLPDIYLLPAPEPQDAR